MNGLPREVLKWLQSLDLSSSVKNPKWDFSNGYLVAEILSWYHPKAINMKFFINGTSIQSKILNWNLLRTFFRKKHYAIDQDVIDGAMHCKTNAAEVLVEQLYTLLTNRPTYRLEPRPINFSDLPYQVKLPLHARATAATSIKNNLATTELICARNSNERLTKTFAILDLHSQHRQMQRVQDPVRFGIKPAIGYMTEEEKERSKILSGRAMSTRATSKGNKSRPVSANKPPEVIQFTEVVVKQSGREKTVEENLEDRPNHGSVYRPTSPLSSGYQAIAQLSR